MYLLQVVSRPPPLGIESDLFRCVQLAKEVQFYFKIESNWAPSHHGISCWDRLPFNYNRYPKTYGHISFAALEGPNRKIMISSSPLYSEQDEHKSCLIINQNNKIIFILIIILSLGSVNAHYCQTSIIFNPCHCLCSYNKKSYRCIFWFLLL